MEWASVFDVAHPQPGATEGTLARFITEVGRPLSEAERGMVRSTQRNPFPEWSPHHQSWRPFDVSAWSVPNRPLPEAYLSFLRWSDGGEFGTGDRWFQFFPTRDEAHGVRAMLLAYELPQYMPGAVPIAFNGGGTFYLLDMRQPAVNGEYPVVCAHAGYLSWAPDACWPIADSFLAACQGRDNVDDVRDHLAQT